jgi:hypothetical protein
MNSTPSTSFSAALAALKEGKFVRRAAWGDEFLCVVGAHEVATDCVADEALSAVLSAAEASHIVDIGNFRKFDLDAKTVVNGWIPSAYELLSEDWGLYDSEEIATLKIERELQAALAGPGTVASSDLAGIISATLGKLGVAHQGEYTAGAKAIDLVLHAPHKGVILRVTDGGYILRPGGKDDTFGREVVVGKGRLQAELKSLVPTTVSKREFYRTLFTFEVLSEEPIPDVDAFDVLHETDQGEYVGDWKRASVHKISAPLAVMALERIGSDSSFFALTPEGADAEESD